MSHTPQSLPWSCKMGSGMYHKSALWLLSVSPLLKLWTLFQAWTPFSSPDVVLLLRDAWFFMSFFFLSNSLLALLAFIFYIAEFCPKTEASLYLFFMATKEHVSKTLWHFLSVNSGSPTHFYFKNIYLVSLKIQSCFSEHDWIFRDTGFAT